MGNPKNNSTTTQSSSSYQPNPQALGVYQDILSRASNVASQPYTPYSGEMVAGFSPLQQQVFGGIGQNYQNAQGYFDTAADYARTAASPINAQQIENYQNPYQKSVIDATMANVRENEAQQRNALTGNAIARGAYGGDRAGIAQAELARQQELARNQTIAGLNAQNYTQALSAAQNDAARAGQGAFTFGNLGTAAQNSALTAGAMQQQNEQSKLSADYQQYLQQLAFPYQQLGFLSSIAAPIGGALGGTTTGTSSNTPPKPSTASQIAGAALSVAPYAFMALSDERAKEDVRQVGEMFDGQPVYRFRYKGDPRVQVGLIAQDVERDHPEAVSSIGGAKMVDYDRATQDAAYADGGAIGGSPFDFISDVGGYVPRISIQAPALPKPQAMQPAVQASGTENPYMPLANGVSNFAKAGGFEYFRPTMGSPGVDSPIPMIGSAGDYAVPTFMKNGGSVDAGFLKTVKAIKGGLRNYAGGGEVPDFNHAFGQFDAPAVPSQDFSDNYFRINGASPETFSMVQSQNPEPSAASAPAALPGPFMPPPGNAAAPQPDQIYAGMPESGAMSFMPEPQPSALPLEAFTPFSPAAQKSGSVMTPEAAQAISAAGLAMMAGTSPYAAVNIGQGGLAGLKTYGELQRAKQAAKRDEENAKMTQRRVYLEAKRLAQQAAQFAKSHGLNERNIKSQIRDRDERSQQGNYQYLGQSADGAGSVFLNKKTGAIETKETGIAAKPGANLSAGEKAVDQAFAKDYAPFVTGGFADVQKGLSQLNEVAEKLKAGTGNYTGRVIGNMPEKMQQLWYPEAVDTREAVEEVVQRNLRLILGAQFTQKEGERLIARAFNPALDEKTNAKRITRLMRAMKNAYDAKVAAADYYEKHGTLKGYKGTITITTSDIAKDYEQMQDVPDRPSGVPEGSQYSPSRRQWRASDGSVYDARGKKVQ